MTIPGKTTRQRRLRVRELFSARSDRPAKPNGARQRWIQGSDHSLRIPVYAPDDF